MLLRRDKHVALWFQGLEAGRVLAAVHEGLEDAAFRWVGAALVLLPANHTGKDAVVLDAIAGARATEDGQ